MSLTVMEGFIGIIVLLIFLMRHYRKRYEKHLADIEARQKAKMVELFRPPQRGGRR